MIKRVLFFCLCFLIVVACTNKESSDVVSYHYDTNLNYDESLIILDSISNCINDSDDMGNFAKTDSIFRNDEHITVPYQIYCSKENFKSIGVYDRGDTLKIALIEKEKTPNYSLDCPVWVYGTLIGDVESGYMKTPFGVYPLKKK